MAAYHQLLHHSVQLFQINDSVDTPLNVVICHEKLSSQFAQILPDEYSYIFKEIAPPSTDNITLRITVFTDVTSENEARKWISRFESHTYSELQEVLNLQAHRFSTKLTDIVII